MPPYARVPPHCLQVSAAGALAVANTATVRASGSGGGAADNTVAAAGFVASGGPAAAAAAMQIPGANNVVLGAGLPFTEQQLVAAIVRTVMDSVFVSSSGLNAGLANVQTQLCLGMAPGGAIRGWVEGALYDAGFVSDVVNIANGVLCGANPLRLSDIPGMAASDDGGALGFKSLLALATVREREGVGRAAQAGRPEPQRWLQHASLIFTGVTAGHAAADCSMQTRGGERTPPAGRRPPT